MEYLEDRFCCVDAHIITCFLVLITLGDKEHSGSVQVECYTIGI